MFRLQMRWDLPAGREGTGGDARLSTSEVAEPRQLSLLGLVNRHISTYIEMSTSQVDISKFICLKLTLGKFCKSRLDETCQHIDLYVDI